MIGTAIIISTLDEYDADDVIALLDEGLDVTNLPEGIHVTVEVGPDRTIIGEWNYDVDAY